MQLGNKGDREMRDEGGFNKGGKGWGNINGGGGGGGGGALHIAYFVLFCHSRDHFSSFIVSLQIFTAPLSEVSLPAYVT